MRILAGEISRRMVLALLPASLMVRSASGAVRKRTIGYLSAASEQVQRPLLDNFRKGLTSTGLQTADLVIHYRWSNGKYDALEGLARELLALDVDVLATAGGSISALAARRVTHSVPIVALMGDDPVQIGLTHSLARPDGNVTGVSQLLRAEGKRLEILRELLPTARVLGFIVNPANVRSDREHQSLRSEAERMGVKLVILPAQDAAGLSAAFQQASAAGVEGVMIGADPFFFLSLHQIVALAEAARMPAVYFFRQFVDAGGLLSYGSRLGDAFEQIGIYTGRVLQGAAPADLPIVQQSDRIETVVNMRAARKLGLQIPTAMLLRAEDVLGDDGR